MVLTRGQKRRGATESVDPPPPPTKRTRRSGGQPGTSAEVAVANEASSEQAVRPVRKLPARVVDILNKLKTDRSVLLFIPDAVRCALDAEMATMSEEELAALTREDARKLIREIQVAVVEQCREWKDKQLLDLNARTMAAVHRLHADAFALEMRHCLDKVSKHEAEVNNKIRQFKDKISRLVHLEKLKYRILITGEFVRYRRRFRDALLSSTTRGRRASPNNPRPESLFPSASASGPSTNRRGHFSVVVSSVADAPSNPEPSPHRGETIAESIAAVDAYENSENWRRVVALLARFDEEQHGPQASAPTTASAASQTNDEDTDGDGDVADAAPADNESDSAFDAESADPGEPESDGEATDAVVEAPRERGRNYPVPTNTRATGGAVDGPPTGFFT